MGSIKIFNNIYNKLKVMRERVAVRAFQRAGVGCESVSTHGEVHSQNRRLKEK